MADVSTHGEHRLLIDGALVDAEGGATFENVMEYASVERPASSVDSVTVALPLAIVVTGGTS